MSHYPDIAEIAGKLSDNQQKALKGARKSTITKNWMFPVYRDGGRLAKECAALGLQKGGVLTRKGVTVRKHIIDQQAKIKKEK